MQTKTYYANSVPAALEEARKELGAEALLVSSKPSAAVARAFGRLEVTFAFDPRLTAGKPAAEQSPMAKTAAVRRPASELDEIREQLAAIRAAVGQANDNAPASGSMAEEGGFAEALSLCCLEAGGLAKETAREIAEAAARRPGDRQIAIREELAGRIPQASWTGMKSGESRTIALVGPAGRGKTTTLIKIAVRFGLAPRVPVRIYGAG